MLYAASKKVATSDDIRIIAGPLDHDIITAILHLGATRQEIMEAFSWLEESHFTRSVSMKPMSECTRRVFEILDYALSYSFQSTHH